MPNNCSQVESLFAAAAELSGESRKAFLERECAGQEALRNQLDGLLRAHDRVDHPLDRPAAGHNELEVTCLSDSLAVGTMISRRYKLLEQIGDGGMGTVWMAEQKEPVKRLVAVKLIKAGMDSKAVLARFEAERQALALMDHPNIAKVHDAGADDAGRPYFVMELVKGLPLTEYCDARKLSVSERLDLFVQICSAVQHAHQKAIIHRDLKPSNVLVTEHDGKPVPKVIDFGLAKALHSSQMLTDRTLHTAFGTVVGTPLYMAPEQVGINALDVDTRTDIYSLGVMLYELLTGTTPLEKAKFKEAAWEEVKRLIREVEPPRPSTRLSSDKTLPSLAACRQVDPRQLRRQVQGELDWIVMKALDKDRGRRYETATGLARDVQRFLCGEAVEACPPTLGYRLLKAYHKHRAAVLVGSMITTVLIVATGVSLNFGIHAARSAETAYQNEQRFQRERDEATTARLALETEQKSRSWSDYVWSIRFAQEAWQQHLLEPARQYLDRCQPELRGWEWHYLNGICKPAEFTPIGNVDDAVFQAKYSQDGRWIVASVYTNKGRGGVSSVQIWDTSTWDKVILSSDLQDVTCVDISPDGQQVLVADRNKVTIWDRESRTSEPLIVDHPNPGKFFASFSPDGTKIATAMSDRTNTEVETIALWDARTRERIGRGHTEQKADCYWVSFSADGRWVCAEFWQPSRRGNYIKIWDVDTGEEFLEVTQECNWSCLSPDGTRLAALDRQNDLKIWRIGRDGNRPVLDDDPIVLEGHTGTAMPRTFSRDSKYLVTAGDDNTVRIWNAATGRQERVLDGAGYVSGADISPDGRSIVTGSGPGEKQGKIWALDSIDSQVASKAERLAATAIQSPQGNLLLSVRSAGATILDARTGKPLRTLASAGDVLAAHRGGWSPDSRRIWISSSGNAANDTKRKVFVYNAETGDLVETLEGVTTPDTDDCFNADGSQILAIKEDGSVVVWDTSTHETWELAKSGTSGTQGIRYSPDGSKILVDQSGPWDATMAGISILDAATRKLIVELEIGELESSVSRGHGVFSRDGRLFLKLVSDPTAFSACDGQIWDTTTGKRLRSFRLNEKFLVSPEFSPDGSRILLAGMLTKLHLIDTQTGDEVLTKPFKGLKRAKFNRDGNQVIVYDGDTIGILDGTPKAEEK